MGAGEAIAYGLLGALGGGAAAVKEQADEARKRDADMAEMNAKTEREMAIEERKLRMAGQIRHEQLPDRLAEIAAETKARTDPLDRQIKQHQLKTLLENDKIPAAVKTEYGSLEKQVEQITGAIAKSQADGSFDANSEGAKELTRRLGEMQQRQSRLLSPYLGDAAEKPSAGIDLSQFDKVRQPQQAAQPAQGNPTQPAKPSMTEAGKSGLLSQARAIKQKYGNKIPSKYMSGGLSENEQRIIDAADAASSDWRKF
jgi:hypothetical protein